MSDRRDPHGGEIVGEPLEVVRAAREDEISAFRGDRNDGRVHRELSAPV